MRPPNEKTPPGEGRWTITCIQDSLGWVSSALSLKRAMSCAVDRWEWVKAKRAMTADEAARFD